MEPLRRAARIVRSSLRIASAVTWRANQIPLMWQDEVNWGDALNPLLAGMISGRRAYFTDDPAVKKYLMIGSILWMADARTRVWGAGFIRETDVPKAKPLSIHAVRGPLTHNRLTTLGLRAPKVFGDPAILLPRYYRPATAKRFRLGILPHYVDHEHPLLKRLSQLDGVTLIDVRCSDLSLVDRMLECEAILSSSLHGLICAHAYGLPARRVVFSDKVIGGDFKFRDYFAGVELTYDAGLPVDDCNSLEDIISQLWRQQLDGQADVLLNSCPFTARI